MFMLCRDRPAPPQPLHAEQLEPNAACPEGATKPSSLALCGAMSSWQGYPDEPPSTAGLLSFHTPRRLGLGWAWGQATGRGHGAAGSCGGVLHPEGPISMDRARRLVWGTGDNREGAKEAS